MHKRSFGFAIGALMLAACGDDDGGTNLNNNNADLCAGVTCAGHGTCVVDAGQATCDCEAGWLPDGPTCVEDQNAAPEITSTPAAEATELEEYVYAITCTDAEGDALTITLGAADTCDATVIDHGDGTADYRFTPLSGSAGTSCNLQVECHDASGLDTQTATVDVLAGACVEDVTYTGQIYIPNPPDATSSCGGVYVAGPFPGTYDAGLGALRALLPATDQATATVDATLVEATVSAVGYVGTYRTFWLADGTGAAKVWLPFVGEPQLPGFAVRVGQRVSVRVLEILNYSGEAEITQVAAGSWSLVSEDNEVHVADRTGGPDLTLADVDQVVRLTGVLTTTAVACGNGQFCYDLDYGASAPVVFRGSDSTLETGLCLTWVGPTSASSGAIQLRHYAPEWILAH